ncbi:DNA recombination protein RmuC [uncultured Thomasclavelia sp.]|uniref:DNA recombination protein RmuC n=1 Tax=uncultured Thomasclavelia sp. TaxID=3025759 RepID=UPI0025EA8CE1|nr:DNA recombination protein RmuC [uncultured Thomasclavelia sp.]
MIEILIIVCLVFIIALVALMFVQLNKTAHRLQLQQQLLSQKDEMIKQITNNLNSQNEIIRILNQQNQKSLGNDERFDERLKNMSENVQKLLKESSLSSQQVDDIADRIKDINNIMINKKARGNWGEYQLDNLLSVYAGDNQNIFETQYTLKNGAIGDVALHLPGIEKVMIIDSKFPLENYQNLLDEDLSEMERLRYESLFKQNIKKHINDISKKYLTSQTAENAVMFIPSEAIYTYICSHYSELIEYAHSKHVLITSPTTLIGVVFTLINLTKDFNRNKHIKSIEKDIVSMYDDVMRLTERLDNVDISITRLQKAFKDVHISADKIGKRIIKIHDGYDYSDEQKE